MSQVSKHPIFTVSLVCIFMLFSNNILLSRIFSNGSGTGYGDPGEEGAASNATIESMIIEGAGYYLMCDSYIKSLLNRIELQDLNEIDYQEMQELINKALENITNARITYEKLVNKADATSYNPVVIEQLKSFDYKTFMIENRLNDVVFKQVEIYLSAGDITGTLKHVLLNIKEIEKLLVSVQTVTGLSRIEPFWKLNELCSELSLFGSFVARVFYKINQR
jgi:hypothetical protein